MRVSFRLVHIQPPVNGGPPVEFDCNAPGEIIDFIIGFEPTSKILRNLNPQLPEVMPVATVVVKVDLDNPEIVARRLHPVMANARDNTIQELAHPDPEHAAELIPRGAVFHPMVGVIALFEEPYSEAELVEHVRRRALAAVTAAQEAAPPADDRPAPINGEIVVAGS